MRDKRKAPRHSALGKRNNALALLGQRHGYFEPVWFHTKGESPTSGSIFINEKPTSRIPSFDICWCVPCLDCSVREYPLFSGGALHQEGERNPTGRPYFVATADKSRKQTPHVAAPGENHRLFPNIPPKQSSCAYACVAHVPELEALTNGDLSQSSSLIF